MFCYAGPHIIHISVFRCVNHAIFRANQIVKHAQTWQKGWGTETLQWTFTFQTKVLSRILLEISRHTY